jgi:hypothetical protein
MKRIDALMIFLIMLAFWLLRRSSGRLSAITWQRDADQRLPVLWRQYS